MRAERVWICLDEHLGSQLIEYERNMGERTQQEVGPCECARGYGCDPCPVDCLGETLFSNSGRQCARDLMTNVHTLLWRCRRTFPPTLRLVSLTFAISSGRSSTRVFVDWNSMPASTVKCLQRHCAKMRIAS